MLAAALPMPENVCPAISQIDMATPFPGVSQHENNGVFSIGGRCFRILRELEIIRAGRISLAAKCPRRINP